MLNWSREIYKKWRKKRIPIYQPNFYAKEQNKWTQGDLNASYTHNGKRDNELQFTLFTLYFSLSIIIGKLLYGCRIFDAILFVPNFLGTKTVNGVHIIVGFFSNISFYVFNTFTSLSWILWPLIAGIAVTIFTYILTFYDSRIPDVTPPSPLSRHKYRYHLNYMMAPLNGIVTFLLLLYKWYS